MTDLSEVRVGDELLLFSSSGVSRKHRTVTVTKVGPERIYAEEFGRTTAYRTGTGVIIDGYGDSYLITPEQHAEKMRRKELMDKLAGFGINVTILSLSVEKLEALVAVMEEA